MDEGRRDLPVLDNVKGVEVDTHPVRTHFGEHEMLYTVYMILWTAMFN